MSQKLPVDGFEWVEENDLSKFNASFIKNYDENNNRRYILEVDIEYLKNLYKLHNDLQFLPERMKINVISLIVLYKIKNFYCSPESFKTSIKSRINTKKST